MYTFIKLENHFKGMNLQYGWCFKAKSIQDIMDYNDRYLLQKIQDGVHDIIAGYKHATSVWRTSIDSMSSVNGDGFLKNSMKLERDITTGQLKSLMSYGALYFQRCGSYLVPSEGVIELDTIEKEEEDPLASCLKVFFEQNKGAPYNPDLFVCKVTEHLEKNGFTISDKKELS